MEALAKTGNVKRKDDGIVRNCMMDCMVQVLKEMDCRSLLALYEEQLNDGRE